VLGEKHPYTAISLNNLAALYYSQGNYSAGPTFPGADAVQTHMTNSRLTDPEILESRFPVLLERFALRPGSGGAGRFPGGNGVIRQFLFRQPVTVSILSQRRRTVPWGLAGGQPGQPGEIWLIRADGREIPLPACGSLSLGAGERLFIKTPGGGGFGVPDLGLPLKRKAAGLL
jgi:5-oxoprolinase (ATP-hydrolysing)